MTVGETPPLGTDPLLDQVVADRYKVIRRLGEGGMGAVYLAEHVVIQKKMALKVLAPELARRPDLVARFLQEARSASRIGHENVIDISDFGQAGDGYVYIAMEFLDGRDLGDLVRSKGALPWPRTRDIVMQICRALRAAHDKGIVHRDMKPENIYLIHREGQPDFVKILDFGIAKVMGVGDQNGPRLTRTGMIFGTPEYMAPEQAEGKDADHRVDVYAVGCIIYHLITGQTPFVADSFMAMLTKHMMEDPVPPSVRRPDLAITPDMDALVLKALEKDRDNRYQSMAEFLDAVTSCEGPEEAPADARPGATRAIGGANREASVHPRRATAPKGNRVTAAARPQASAASPMLDEKPEPSRLESGSKQKLLVVILGVGLGFGAALWFLLGRTTIAPTAETTTSTSTSSTTTPTPPTPAVVTPPPTTTPVAPVAPAAATTPIPTVATRQTGTAPESSDRPSEKQQPHRTSRSKPQHPVVTPTPHPGPLPTPPLPPPPTGKPAAHPELKPFPE
jgi:serine/threonine-protein kinase